MNQPGNANAAEAMKAVLRRDLGAAMKRRDKAETALLRQLVAALDNAEAVPVQAGRPPALHHAFADGSAERERRQLTGDDVRALLVEEMRARVEAAAEMARLGALARAATLDAEVEIMRRYVRA